MSPRDTEGDVIALQSRVDAQDRLIRTLLAGIDDMRSRQIAMDKQMQVLLEGVNHLVGQSQATAEMILEIHTDLFEEGPGEGEMVN